MIADIQFKVERGGVRLDAALLARFPSSTRAFVRDAIASGGVLVNGRRAPKGVKLSGGETVSVAALREASDNVVRPNRSISVATVFEDDALLAFDKPAGMPVQPLTCDETDTLMNGVVAAHPECAPLGDRPLMAGAIHRIDAKTLKKMKDIELGKSHYNGIARYGSGFIVRVMGGNKLVILNKRWHKVRTIKTKGYTTSQGMAQKGGIIYRVYSKGQSSDKNYLVTFDKRGKQIKRRRVEVTGELECVFLVDGVPWFTVYRKKKVNGKMKYMAYIAKGA